jgi:dTDP-4-amino-4,6-dideoxygalactose transaminase
MALELPLGAEVALPAFGFPATASAVILAGLRPQLVAVDEDLHVDIEDLEGRATDATQAILAVHMRGFVAPLHQLAAVAERLGVPLVEDAVPALGARYDGRLVGTYGIAGCFSTQSDKTINTGEGGFLITDDPDLYERAVLLSGAFEGRYQRHLADLRTVAGEHSVPLFNFRIDELRSALARTQLETIDTRVANLRQNYTYVASRLEGVPGARLRRPSAPDAYLGDALVFFVDPAFAAWVARAISMEGVTARNFGSPHEANVRAFWHWRFMEGHVHRDTPEFQTSVTSLCSAIDIALSPDLSRADLDDLVAAVSKVMASVPEGTTSY